MPVVFSDVSETTVDDLNKDLDKLVLLDGYIYCVAINGDQLPITDEKEAKIQSKILAKKWLSRDDRKLYWCELTRLELILYHERPIPEDEIEPALIQMTATQKKPQRRSHMRSRSVMASKFVIEKEKNDNKLEKDNSRNKNIFLKIPILLSNVSDGDELDNNNDDNNNDDNVNDYDDDDDEGEDVYLILVEPNKTKISDHTNIHHNNYDKIASYYWISAEDEPDKYMWIDKLNQTSHPIIEDQTEEDNFNSMVFDEWEIEYDNIVIEKKIGGGAYGDVYKARVWGTDTAVKVLKNLTEDEKFVDTSSQVGIQLTSELKKEALADLKNEIAILSTLRHPNNVLYIGACTKPPNPVCIITEWCSRGSLQDVINDPDVHLNTEIMINLALGIAQGVNYLHNLKRKIIHRDLKSQNILVDTNFNAKVADFGLSSTLKIQEIRNKDDPHYDSTSEHLQGIIGTPGYMAPEVIASKSYNEKVDVYSYGILLCELFCRQDPFLSENFQCNEDLHAFVLKGGQPKIPSWVPMRMISLIRRCLSLEPSDRPAFSDIISCIRSWFLHMDDISRWLNCDCPRLSFLLNPTASTIQQQHWAAKELSTYSYKQFSKRHILFLTQLLGSNDFGVRTLSASALANILKTHCDISLKTIIVQNNGIAYLLSMIKHKPERKEISKRLPLSNPSNNNNTAPRCGRRRGVSAGANRRKSIFVQTNNDVVDSSVKTAESILLTILGTWSKTQVFPLFTEIQKRQLEQILLREQRRIERKRNDMELTLSHHSAVIQMIKHVSQVTEDEKNNILPLQKNKNNLNICSNVLNAGKFIKQHVYRCITCNLHSNGKGVCLACKETCHIGHQFENNVLWALFYCDCQNAGMCQCSNEAPRKRGSSTPSFNAVPKLDLSLSSITENE